MARENSASVIGKQDWEVQPVTPDMLGEEGIYGGTPESRSAGEVAREAVDNGEAVLWYTPG